MLLLTLLFALGLWAEAPAEPRPLAKRVLDGLLAEDRKRADWNFTIHREVKELDADGRVKSEKTRVIPRKPEQGRKRDNAWFYELSDALEFRETGEETVDGRPALVVELSPRAGYRAKNMRARLFEKMRGKVLVDKADAELVRADVEVFDTVSVGLGILGKVNKGTQFHLERRRVAEGTWLTNMQQVLFGARIMLKSFHQEVTTRYSGFERFGRPSAP